MDRLTVSGSANEPWTISMPLTAEPDYEMYEYACHEGNYAMENVLRGARLLEAEALGQPLPETR